VAARAFSQPHPGGARLREAVDHYSARRQGPTDRLRILREERANRVRQG